MKTVAVIDADSVLYAVAHNAEAHMGDGLYVPVLTEDQALKEVWNRLHVILDELDADDAIVALSSGRNWRKNILPSYKENRKDLHRPMLLGALRTAVLDSDVACFRPMCIRHLEADDVCGISAGFLMKNGKEAIIVSQDKDMLTIPGLHYNPRPSSAGTRRQVEHVTEPEADRNHLFQTLVGDAVDNYKGCPGIGPVKAIKILNATEDAEPWERWEAVEEVFVAKLGDEVAGKEEALVQARVSRILRASDWDAKRKKVILWKPPTFERAVVDGVVD